MTPIALPGRGLVTALTVAMLALSVLALGLLVLLIPPLRGYGELLMDRLGDLALQLHGASEPQKLNGKRKRKT